MPGGRGAAPGALTFLRCCCCRFLTSVSRRTLWTVPGNRSQCGRVFRRGETPSPDAPQKCVWASNTARCPPPQQKQYHAKGSVSDQASTLLTAAAIGGLDCLSHFIGPFDYGAPAPTGRSPKPRGGLWSGPINALRSRATVVPLTFPVLRWVSVRVSQRETEAPLQISLFPSITSAEDQAVKEGTDAGASHPCYGDNERSVVSCKFAKRAP